MIQKNTFYECLNSNEAVYAMKNESDQWLSGTSTQTHYISRKRDRSHTSLKQYTFSL